MFNVYSKTLACFPKLFFVEDAKKRHFIGLLSIRNKPIPRLIRIEFSSFDITVVRRYHLSLTNS